VRVGDDGDAAGVSGFGGPLGGTIGLVVGDKCTWGMVAAMVVGDDGDAAGAPTPFGGPMEVVSVGLVVVVVAVVVAVGDAAGASTPFGCSVYVTNFGGIVGGNVSEWC
jgi:hypothetical protein